MKVRRKALIKGVFLICFYLILPAILPTKNASVGNVCGGMGTVCRGGEPLPERALGMVKSEPKFWSASRCRYRSTSRRNKGGGAVKAGAENAGQLLEVRN